MNYFPRTLFGLGLVMAWAPNLAVLHIEGLPHARGLAKALPLEVLVTPAGFGVASALFLALVVAWVLRWREQATGWSMIGALWLMSIVESNQWADGVGGNRALVLPGAALMAYLVTAAWSRRRGDTLTAQEWYAVEAACGVAAGAYFIAGASKIWGSGLAWGRGGNLAIQIMTYVTQGNSDLIAFRLSVADNLWLCTFFGVSTLIIECGFVLFIFRSFRKPLSVLATLMHLSIAVVMGLHHYDWMFIEMGLAWYTVRSHGHLPPV